MPSPEIFQSGELFIECVSAPSVLRLDWKGRSVARRPDQSLSPYLLDMVDRALATSCELEMHFEALDFFNSSTVAVLVQVLQRAQAKGVRTALTYLPTVRWQQLSFEALRVFEQRDHAVKVIPLSAA